MARHEKTCNWIFSRPEFQDWESVTNAIAKPKLLWIHSGPGFGKTVLCAKIIDHMIENNVPMVYFFCVADEETKRQPYAILRSWIDQLTHANEDALDIVFDVYKSIETRPPTSLELWKLFNILSKGPDDLSLTAILLHVVSICLFAHSQSLLFVRLRLISIDALGKAIPCTFVIDGFDECSMINKSSQRYMTDGRSEFLESLIISVTDTIARILIVSRDTEDIRAQLGKLAKSSTPMLFEYAITVNDTKDDVSHCSLEMANTKLVNKPAALKAHIAFEAAKKSDGMFLWLQLLSRKLDPGENAKKLRSIVSEMPAEINDTYERDLERVQNLDPYQKARAIAILRWILFASRPLTIRELAEAVAMTVDDPPDAYPRDELPDSWETGYVDEQYVNSYIRRSCGSLVELRGHNEKKPLALHTVYFVHFSVKEYLLRSNNPNNSPSRVETICFPDGSKEHNRLAQLCLQYLCYDVFGERNDFQDEKRIQVYPFLAYAAKSWYTHALHDHKMPKDIIPCAQKLFNPSTSNWILWSRVFEGELKLEDELTSDDEPETHDQLENSNEQDVDDKDSAIELANEAEEVSHVDSQPSPIYYAALLGLTDLVKALHSQGLDCGTSGGRYGFPLQAAVCNSHQETVEYLVQQGINLNQQGGRYSTAICAAAALGSERMLEVLIEAGADLKCEDHLGRNCLHFASKEGSQATIQRLLKAGLDPMKKSKLDATPFYLAVESGNRANVQLILDAGAEVNDRRKDVPAIMSAVFLGYQEIVEELLKNRADVNLSDSNGLTCLHEAVIEDRIAIINILLANSADVNAQSKYGWTALGYAVDNKKHATAELLIDRGADVNTSDNSGWTPLHLAAELACVEIVDMLVQRGAEVDAENSSSYTSLFSAVWTRSTPCVRTLLAHGASVAKINNMGNTVLDEAAELGDKDIIECLLDHDALCCSADHNPQTNTSSTDAQEPTLAARISKAIFNKDEEVALQLIDRGDSALLQGNIDVALQSCSLFDLPSLVVDLLKRGASLIASTHNKRTALHLAAKNNSLEIVRTLIEFGADIQTKDMSGYTPLDLSLSDGLANLETVEYLVKNGAIATTPTKDGGMISTVSTGYSILGGRWEGTYTYSSWRKGDVEPTALTIHFDHSGSVESKYSFWRFSDNDEAGRFEVLGHLLTDNTIRFLKLYESTGWLYLGVFDPETLTIQGTWGSSVTVRHGLFEMKKVKEPEVLGT